VYHAIGGNLALDVTLGRCSAFFQHILLKEQKVQVLGISLLPVSTFCFETVYVSSVGVKGILNPLSSNRLRTRSLASAMYCFLSSSWSSGASAKAHSPVDLFIAIYPPNGIPCASAYKKPCMMYPNGSSSFMTS